jgi:Autotransporter beta-domain
VRTKNSFWFVCTRLALALAATLLTVAPLRAADWTYRPLDRPTPTYTADFGMRFWYGKTTTAKNLYDSTGAELVSRLTYGDLSIFAAEVYGRFDLDKRWFVKGYIGGGTFRNGSFRDEDFGLPPPLQPYSSTLSVQQDSTPIYGSLDAGFNVVWGPDFRVGLFGGLHYMNQTISAYGCTQTSYNPYICGAFPIPNQIKVITQDNNWYSVRLGVDATFEFDRFRLSVDAAVVPYAWLYGADTHWLRVGNQPGDFSGPLPEDGKGWGYQLDAFLSYRVYESLSVGVGARYWYMQSRGFTHFENHVVGFTAFPQVVEWKTQNFGVFLQASLKLGPYSVLDVH